MMVTELCLSEDEFQAFHVKEETQVTFCLKEFRVSLLPLSLPSFEMGGLVLFPTRFTSL